jgi:serine kinase of HPr protein (carbohydrate metabolism regulator)
MAGPIAEPSSPSLHGSAVLVGAYAALIRGAAGAGKSRLAFGLIEAARTGSLPFARLVGDDRVHLEAAHGRLIVRPAPVLAGLIELRGIGLFRLPYEPLAVVGLVIDLAAPDSKRMPDREAQTATVCGISLPRLAVAAGIEPLPLVLARISLGRGDDGGGGKIPSPARLVGEK